MSDAVQTTTNTETAKTAPSTEATATGEPVDEIAAALAAVEAEGEPAEAKGGEKAGAEQKAATKDEGDKDQKKDESDKKEEPKSWDAVRRIEKKLAKRNKDMDAREQQIAAAEQRMKAVEQRERELDEDPVAYLAKKGLSFDDLAKRYLNNGQASPEELARRAAAKSSEADKANEERIARLEAALQKNEMDRLLGDYRDGIKASIAGDELELLRAWPDAETEVFEFANKWAEQKKEVLTPRDAALKLQSELRKQLEGLLSHQAVLKLVNAGNGAQLKQVVSGQSQVPRGSGANPKTLTNNLAATPAVEPSLEPMSDEDEVQAALRLVQG